MHTPELALHHHLHRRLLRSLGLDGPDPRHRHHNHPNHLPRSIHLVRTRAAPPSPPQRFPDNNEEDEARDIEAAYPSASIRARGVPMLLARGGGVGVCGCGDWGRGRGGKEVRGELCGVRSDACGVWGWCFGGSGGGDEGGLGEGGEVGEGVEEEGEGVRGA